MARRYSNPVTKHQDNLYNLSLAQVEFDRCDVAHNAAIANLEAIERKHAEDHANDDAMLALDDDDWLSALIAAPADDDYVTDDDVTAARKVLADARHHYGRAKVGLAVLRQAVLRSQKVVDQRGSCWA